TNEGGRCDIFAVHASRSPTRWGELSEMPALGSYQVDHRFSCDLGHSVPDWMPAAIVNVAQLSSDDREREGSIANMEDGLPPYTCGPVEAPAFRVVLNGTTCLNGNPICTPATIATDCGAGAWDCLEGCCYVEARPK